MKLIKIFILFLCLFMVSIYVHNSQKPLNCKVLDIIEADEFLIDINNNNLIDKNEYVKIDGIRAFSPLKTDFLNKITTESGLSYEQMLKAGYLARNWAKDNLKNKEVLVYGLNKCYKNEVCKVDIYFQGENLAEFLLENGLAYVDKNSKSKKYVQFYSPDEIRVNARELSKLDFVLLNLKTNIAHKLNSEHAKKMNYAELILKSQARDLGSIFCFGCFENFPKKPQIPSFNIPKSKNSYKKSISKTFSNVELFLINPLEFDKPNAFCGNAFCKRLLKEINSSAESIDVALYGLGDQREIFEALKSAKERGVKIRAVCNYSKDMDMIYPYTSSFIREFGAVCNKKQSLMHNKFFIFDNKTLLTGSVNISSTGSGGYNANAAVIIHDKNIVKIFKNEFNQMFLGKFSNTKKSDNLNNANSPIKAYFSPNDAVYENVFVPIIQNAKESIYVSAFYLTDINLIKELILAKRRGVEVLVMLDATSANNFKGRLNSLRASSIPVIVENWGGKNHEKTMVVDKKILILGSCNFSKSGFYKNDENVLVFEKPDMAAFYADYYLYLFNSIDKKFLRLIPRAEGFESKNSCTDGIDNNFDGKIDSEDDGCRARAKNN